MKLTSFALAILILLSTLVSCNPLTSTTTIAISTTTTLLPAFAAKQLNPFGLEPVEDHDGNDVNSTPTLVDIDGDGDLDLFSGEALGDTIYFENITTDPDSPLFDTKFSNPFSIGVVVFKTRLFFADIDNDGDFDFFRGNENGYFFMNRNVGDDETPNFVSVTGVDSPLNGRQTGGAATPTFADLDGDGDLDLMSGHWMGWLYYFQNSGTNSAPVFPEYGTVNPFGLGEADLSVIDIYGYSHPTFGDLDGDGDLDLIVGSSSGDFYYFQNIGTATSPQFAEYVLNPFGLTNVGDSQSTPFLVDFDGDGDLDLFVGDIDGNISYYENTSIDG